MTQALKKQSWELIGQLFDECQVLAPEERMKLLNEAYVDNEIKGEVMSLLNAMDKPKHCFDTPLFGTLTEIEDAPTSLPEVIGKYRIMSKLGQGGMAEVFLARNEGPGGFQKYVALKRIRSEYCEEREFCLMLEYEAKLCGRLNHPNIVNIHDFTEVDHAYVLVMEYVQGRNLYQLREKLRQRKQKVPFRLALFIALEVAKAVNYAHEAKDESTGESLGIIHRDLSPGNVMISYQGVVKVVDFGIAKAIDRVEITQMGQLRGTANYLSPEAVAHASVDQRSDIFSMGLLLYELLTGEALFDGEMTQVLDLIYRCELPLQKIKELNLDFDLKRVLLRALAKDLDSRYQNTKQFYDELYFIAESKGATNESKQLADFMGLVFGEEKSVDQTDNVQKTVSQKALSAKTARLGIEHARFQSVTTRIPSTERHFKSLMFSKWTGVTLCVLAVSGLYLNLNNRWKTITPSNVSPKNILALPGIPRTLPQANAKTIPSTIPSLAPQCILEVNSFPKGAKIFLGEQSIGQTPVHIVATCGQNLNIRLLHSGYESVRFDTQGTHALKRLAIRLKAVSKPKKNRLGGSKRAKRQTKLKVVRVHFD